MAGQQLQTHDLEDCYSIHSSNDKASWHCKKQESCEEIIKIRVQIRELLIIDGYGRVKSKE